MRMALVLLQPIVDDVHLAPDDRLDALGLRRLEEIDHPGHRAVVGERDGRHLEARGFLGERGDATCPVEDRVLGVDVQVDERSTTHGRAILLRSVGRPGDDSSSCGSHESCPFRTGAAGLKLVRWPP